MTTESRERPPARSDERLEALTRAWSLAGTLLVVSVMLANQNDPRGERFRDGVMTRRGTFQKYDTQGELKAFVGQVLDVEPIAVAPGIVYAFRDQDAEQRFLMDRWRSGRTRLREPTTPVRERAPHARSDKREETYQVHKGALEGLWSLRLELGRRPDKTKVTDALALTDAFGSVNKALRFIEARQEADSGGEALDNLLAAAEQTRQDDLRVYFALGYNALLALTEQVLDPVIDWFGMIRLTYGFCSPALAKAIRARGGGPIDPKRDQHAAHGRNRLGNPVCPRLTDSLCPPGIAPMPPRSSESRPLSSIPRHCRSVPASRAPTPSRPR